MDVPDAYRAAVERFLEERTRRSKHWTNIHLPSVPVTDRRHFVFVFQQWHSTVYVCDILHSSVQPEVLGTWHYFPGAIDVDVAIVIMLH